MAEDWAERQRHTNRLARKLASHVFNQKKISVGQIYGISKLAWITKGYEGKDAAYISSTKIPALGNIFKDDFSGQSLEDIAKAISDECNDHSLIDLVNGHSGFTNFYSAYRNSVFTWIEDNYSVLLPLYKSAYKAKNETDRYNIISTIKDLPGIPKANHPKQLMKPEYFLTPVFFMLDPEIRFPLINGNEWVRNLLHTLKVSDSDLTSQFSAMVKLYGNGGIKDAADLDQVGRDLPDFVTTNEKQATKKLLEEKEQLPNGELPLKDEEDIEAIRKAGTLKQRKIHNQLTNKLKKTLSKYTLLEGKSRTCMFDALVKGYNGQGDDLLIEVKSSIESPHVRMAVGQLFDYWYTLNGDEESHLCILLPTSPSNEIKHFLAWLDIGLIWFEDNQLCTANNWLKCIASKS
jgi:hypothetical protein